MSTASTMALTMPSRPPKRTVTSIAANGIGISSGASPARNAAPNTTSANSRASTSISLREAYVSGRNNISSTQKRPSSSALVRICPAVPGIERSVRPCFSSSPRSARSRSRTSGVTTTFASTMRSFSRTVSRIVSTALRTSCRRESVSATLASSVGRKTTLRNVSNS